MTHLPTDYVIRVVANAAGHLKDVREVELEEETDGLPLILLRTHHPPDRIVDLYLSRRPNVFRRHAGVCIALAEGGRYEMHTPQSLLGDRLWRRVQIELRYARRRYDDPATVAGRARLTTPHELAQTLVWLQRQLQAQPGTPPAGTTHEPS
ncbi:hypothetical protein [Deinococcus pimensis]|uniref:hypothetical protein n=1 Tax=Deinococcus pimensis TaxID=309888 RepID=UPI0004842A26|nr:hypothetical protein [Deinococcus pimensis]